MDAKELPTEITTLVSESPSPFVPNLLIKSCYKKIKSNVDIINSNVTRIKREKNMWILETEYNVYSFEKIQKQNQYLMGVSYHFVFL